MKSPRKKVCSNSPTDYFNTEWLKPLALSLACLLLVATGCVEGVANVDGTEPDAQDDTQNSNQDEGKTLEQLSTEEMALIQLQRDAIDQGLELGKYALADELNIVMADMGINQRYDASVQDGEVYIDVDAAKANSCPFVDQTPPTVANTDCRALADRAVVAAYATMTRVQDDNPLETRFDRNRDENEFWYEQGIMTGMDNEAILAVRRIRQLDVCDQAPEERQSAREAGVERGREIYIEEVNKRMEETGRDLRYPELDRQIEVCQADRSLLMPARSRAIERIDQDRVDNPLCGSYNPANPDEANRLTEAEQAYADGIRRGIDSEHSLAEEAIFRVVPCNVGDPLVLDVAGDGINVVPVTRSEVNFDLFDVGEPVRTAWIQGDDALLVLDRNDNGTIDNGRELFGNFVGDSGFNEVNTGFDHLATWDSVLAGGNNDRVIDERDAVFNKLQLWQDYNGDGISQNNELASLPEHGVAGIRLDYSRIQHEDRQVTHSATFIRNVLGTARYGKMTGTTYDVFFRYGRAR